VACLFVLFRVAGTLWQLVALFGDLVIMNAELCRTCEMIPTEIFC
jgi:hypothetical protein